MKTSESEGVKRQISALKATRERAKLPNGKELDIYSDLIPDDVYEERREKLAELKDAYDDLFK